MTPIRRMHLNLAAITEPDRLVLMEACAAESDPVALLLLVGRFAIARVVPYSEADPADYEPAAALETAIGTLTTELTPYLEPEDP